MLDHAGVELGHLSAAQAEKLARENRIDILGTKRRIRTIRFRAPEPVTGRGFAIRRPGFGAPHRRDTERNPRGVWTFEKMPLSARAIFTEVLDGCLKRAA